MSGYFGGVWSPASCEAETTKESVPSAKTKKTMGDRAFQVTAPFLWNKLPRSAREATNLESFKTLIKTFLFKESLQLS